MNHPIPDYLRLHVEEPPAAAPPENPAHDALERLCASFRKATGWALRQASGPAPLQSPEVLWARSLAPGGQPPRHLAIHRSPGKTAGDLQQELLPVCDLVDSIADLVGQLHDTREALWRREAELAAGIPLVAHSDDRAHLAERLQAVLRGAAEAVDAQAAALYLLDEGTSELKLRSAWGLPRDRLLKPARPLRGAIADLEALTGHAVAIEDVRLLPHWKVPEAFASAVCVPVSSATTPLGTLWVFCDRARDFTDQQTNIIEIVAGCIAADLEREVLLSAALEQRTVGGGGQRLHEFHDAQLPIGPIETDRWQVAGLCQQGAAGGGAFYDWFMHEDGSLTLALAGGAPDDWSGAMTLQLVRGSAKAAMLQSAALERLVRGVADVVWTSTAGGAEAALAAVKLPAVGDHVEFCSAGPQGALVVRPDRPSAINQGAAPLGSDPDANYRGASHAVSVGDAVVLFSDAVRKAADAGGAQLGEAAIADCVREHLAQDAEQIAHHVYHLWRQHTGDPQREAAILVARRMR